AYDQDVEWCAAWAPYLGYGADSLGLLLAGAIDAGGETGDRVFDILKQSATNEHEIGSMGRHVSRALLVASRPDGWEFMEKMLLAAQRQEGLRQVILETIDEAHPTAFRRMFRLSLEHDLLRFSATVRAADVWFGLRWDSATPGVIKKTIEQTLVYLDNPEQRQEAMKKETGEQFHLALWSQAVEDIMPTIPLAAACRTDDNLERRFVAVNWLINLTLTAARAELPAFIDDADLRIAVRAFNACP